MLDSPQCDEHTLDEIVPYIEWLVAWYCREPSVFLDNVILERLESLRLRVNQGDILDPSLSRVRLVKNWEHVAEHGRTRMRP